MSDGHGSFRGILNWNHPLSYLQGFLKIATFAAGIPTLRHFLGDLSDDPQTCFGGEVLLQGACAGCTRDGNLAPLGGF